MKKYLLILVTLILTFPLDIIAQEETINVTGIVRDSQGELLVGVNIVVKDRPGFGTVTDINGKYRIKVSPYSTLLFTYIGYDKVEVGVKTKTEINVTMKETSNTCIG